MSGADWVELRVHGVSGAPPESILDRPYCTQVAGDADSRYFRAVDSSGHELRGADGHVVEAYHWGRFTSGSWLQALWMVLLPFGMVNAAQFMLPAAGPGLLARIWHLLCGALLRFVALMLTLLLTFAAGLILIDLLAWRWAPGSRQLGSFPETWTVGLAIVATALVSYVLYRLGRGYGVVDDAEPRKRTEGRYVDAVEPGEPRTPLARDRFYRGDTDAPVLRNLHLAAAVLTVASMGAWAVHPDGWVDRDPVLLASTIALVLVVVLTTLLGDPEGTASLPLSGRIAAFRLWWHVTMVWIARGAIAVAVVLLALSAWGASDVDRAAAERPVMFDDVANGLLWAGLAALILLGFANLALVLSVRGSWGTTPGHRAFRPYALGMTAYLVASIAAFLGVGLSAAAATGVSSLLDLSVRTRTTAEGIEVDVGTTPMLDRVSYAWGLNLLLFALLATGAGIWMMARRRADRARAAGMFAAADGGPRLSAGWLETVARAIGTARLKNLIPVGGTVFVLFGTLLGIALALELAGCQGGQDFGTCRSLPGPLDLLSQPKYVTGSAAVIWVSNVVALIGAWALITAAAALLATGRSAVSEQGTRRSLNVVWDVIAFWPHAVHPYAPRPYSMRCVTDLRNRLRWYRRAQPAPHVVVCGHSQGSLIAFGALAALHREERDGISLLTFGSQLQVIFPRAFPEYVNLDAVGDVHDVLGGAWINLYRETDPLAGPVLSWRHGAEGPSTTSGHLPGALDGARPDVHVPSTGRHECGDDWRVLDPTPYDQEMNDGAVTGLLKHGHYWRGPDWADALERVRKPHAAGPGGAPEGG
ncbi:hypothetical protein CLV56_0352 [Mumia flava]|uniref:Lipase (Class 3) n=1 Tax=Mumia flava TaxID=1348852 RepID=A0A0B2B2U5_9ACTN|nr:hypothetical protein [Mumia flava]PJJ56148.1 hypothetical protein CLV56_0352 [Mumia flava]